ncbi:MAG: hypothetical protein QM775_17600 [Pirellulales bacterium]
MKTSLKEILRQLREEEMVRLLQQLQHRFADMLRMQEVVIAIRKVCTLCRSHRAAKAKKSKLVA